jgi:hypothetical protein
VKNRYRVPVPHAARAVGPNLLQLGGAERAVLLDPLQERGHQLRTLALDAGHRPPRLVIGGVHPPAEERMQPHREQRGLVRPVLEQLVAWAGEVVEHGSRIAAQPAEGGQVVRAGQHVDRVDLEHGQAVDEPAQLTGADRDRRPRLGEALGCQRHPPGQTRRQPLDLRDAHGADLARWVRQLRSEA